MAFQNISRGTAAAFICALSSIAQAEDDSAILGDTPEISFQQLSHDFGTVYRGEKLTHFFSLQNKGKGFLDIRSIHASCGCFNTQVQPRNRLAPEESGKISFDFDTGWFSGPILRTITVDSNDPEHVTTILEVNANIKEEIRATPSVVTLGEIDKNLPKSATINIEVVTKAPGNGRKISDTILARVPADQEKIKKDLTENSTDTKILAIVSSSPSIILHTEPSVKGMRVEASFKTPLPSGPFRERITVWNTSTHMKELVIPVVGEVVPKTRLSNSYIEFGAVTHGGRSRRSVSLTSTLSDFKIESVQADIKKTESLKNIQNEDLISVTIQSNSRTVTVDLKTPPKLIFEGPSINISGTLIVRTNDPDSKELKVPFFGVLTEDSQP